MKECFDSSTINTSIAYPTLLEKFSKNTGNSNAFNSDYFINKCSLLPIYIPFLEDHRRDLIISIMKYEKATSLNYLLGIQSGHILKKSDLRYCPLCSLDDYNKYNDIYFHRAHQADGVIVCSKHGCFLKEWNHSKLEFSILTYENLDFKVEYELDNFLRNWYIKIAKSFDYLLSNNLYKFNSTKINEMYINYLYALGFATKSSYIKQSELADKFVNFYGEKLLKNLNCLFDKNCTNNWLAKISRNSKNIIQPLKNILLINFVCDSLEDFFNKEFKYNLKELSLKMNCNTMTEYAKKLSVNDKTNSKIINKDNNKRTLMYKVDYRKEMLSFIKQNPDLCKTEIRNSISKQYSWLYKNDKEWLMENLPDNIPRTEVNYKNVNRVDWNERDEKIYSAIKAEYEKMIDFEKSVRITKTQLGKRIDCVKLIRYDLNKLSKTDKLLEEICEDIEAFQKRRIKFAAKQLHDKQGNFKRWELIRDASIKKDVEANLYTYIEEIINEYNI